MARNNDLTFKIAVEINRDSGGELEVREIFPSGSLDEFYGKPLDQLHVLKLGAMLMRPVLLATDNEPDDILAIAEVDPENKVGRGGFVYVVEMGGAFKIGHAVDVQIRLKQIRPILPYPLRVVLAIETPDRFRLESTLHVKFNHRRLNGEWFALRAADIEELNSNYPDRKEPE